MRWVERIELIKMFLPLNSLHFLLWQLECTGQLLVVVGCDFHNSSILLHNLPLLKHGHRDGLEAQSPLAIAKLPAIDLCEDAELGADLDVAVVEEFLVSIHKGNDWSLRLVDLVLIRAVVVSLTLQVVIIVKLIDIANRLCEQLLRLEIESTEGWSERLPIRADLNLHLLNHSGLGERNLNDNGEFSSINSLAVEISRGVSKFFRKSASENDFIHGADNDLFCRTHSARLDLDVVQVREGGCGEVQGASRWGRGRGWSCRRLLGSCFESASGLRGRHFLIVMSLYSSTLLYSFYSAHLTHFAILKGPMLFKNYACTTQSDLREEL